MSRWSILGATSPSEGDQPPWSWSNRRQLFKSNMLFKSMLIGRKWSPVLSNYTPRFIFAPMITTYRWHFTQVLLGEGKSLLDRRCSTLSWLLRGVLLKWCRTAWQRLTLGITSCLHRWRTIGRRFLFRRQRIHWFLWRTGRSCRQVSIWTVGWCWQTERGQALAQHLHLPFFRQSASFRTGLCLGGCRHQLKPFSKFSLCK